MNKEWQDFLTGVGADMPESGALTFAGDDKVAPADVICTVSDQVFLRITGDDAEAFLQGQFSNDIAALAVPGSQLNSWSSPKGRVLILFRIIRDSQGYLLQMPAVLAEPMVRRLRMFVLMAKVVIEPQPDIVSIGVRGRKAVEALLDELSTSMPSSTDGVVQSDGTTLVRIRCDEPRLEVIGSVTQACVLWKKLSADYQSAGDNVWKLQNIDAGVPSIEPATSEAFVLQMLNLQHIDGVSFKKGCFPGQEVVARMQYLGKLKRRMYRMQGTLKDSVSLPMAGDELFSEGVASAAGKVVDAQAVGDGTFRLLAVIAIAAAESPLFLDKEGGREVTLLALPYSVDADE